MYRFLLVIVACCLSSCAYVQTAGKQAYYAAKQTGTPRQRIYKHMLDRDTFFVFGRILNNSHPDGCALAVIAVSDAFQPGEVVDVNQFARTDSFYAMNLPAGDYRLLVVCDGNADGYYDEHEILGGRALGLDRECAPDKVLGDYAIDLALPMVGTQTPLHVKAEKASNGVVDSVFYPKGTIRALNDAIFDPSMATLGLYEPGVFMENAPMLFYALEEDMGYKVPVIFVHGIDGSPREFEAIVARLDRSRYRPWFFYYPSGQSLSQMSEMFYRLFLSGKVIPLEEMPVIIVAHSMGGVIVRDALNRCTGSRTETSVRKLVTIASPLGGHPGARSAKHAPVVIPSWRDMNPDSPFIRQLHRRALPKTLEYHLFYTLGLEGDDSDGVVPVSSQLVPAAQDEAYKQFGLTATHVGVLSEPVAIERILQVIEQVRSPIPEDHLLELLKGGYTTELGEDFTPLETYFIRNNGYYMDALVAGRLQPFHPSQNHFLAACRGECEPTLPVETAWIKFNRMRMERANSSGEEGTAGAGSN
ncbi:MAG: DUF413 domain-containing protein [Verrucomicrobiota bacterium]|nr:DUF413 domain-containing protein [Verrucomicrobiota bacterium]